MTGKLGGDRPVAKLNMLLEDGFLMADIRFELGSGAEEMFTTLPEPGVDFSDVPGDP